MRRYREFSTRNKASVRTPVDPTALTVAVSTLAGVAIEAPVAVNDGAVGRWRVDTTDALYAATDYRIAWTATIAGNTFTRTLRFRHVTPSIGVVPGAPTVAFIRATDTTATFSNTLGANATATLITMEPKNGGATVTASGTVAFLTATGLVPNTTYVWRSDSVNGLFTTPGDMGEFTTRRAAVVDEPLLVRCYFNGESAVGAEREIDVKNELGGFPVGDDRRPLGQGTSALVVLESNHGNWWTLFDLVVRAAEQDMAPFGLGSRSRNR